MRRLDSRRQFLAASAGLAAWPLLAGAQARAKITVAGWSKPISEITNLLAEPDKGFFRARGVELGYVSGAGAGTPSATC